MSLWHPFHGAVHTLLHLWTFLLELLRQIFICFTMKQTHPMMPHCFMITSHCIFSFHCVLIERPLVAEMTYCVFQPEYEKPVLALGFWTHSLISCLKTVGLYILLASTLFSFARINKLFCILLFFFLFRHRDHDAVGGAKVELRKLNSEDAAAQQENCSSAETETVEKWILLPYAGSLLWFSWCFLIFILT